MMRTGIFLYHQKGERLRDFPQALEGILEKENVFFYDAFYPLKPPSSYELEPVSAETLYRVHFPEMVEEVKRTGEFEGALLSVAGTVRAAEKIWMKEIENAFVFTGYGDHHAGSHFFGGGCYFNGAAIAIQELRTRFGAKRFAIIDTDAHHGEGTWQIFEEDPDVLYVCFCPDSYREGKNKVNIQVPHRIMDEQYLGLVREHFLGRTRDFQPEILFWNWGFDGTQGEYGDMGLTPEAHVMLAKQLRTVADDVCRGKFIIVLCGGSQRNLARYIIPKIIRILSEDQA